jgi:hypothetical protein
MLFTGEDQKKSVKSISGGEIEFSYKDYKNSKRGSKAVEATIKMSSTQFLDRLLFLNFSTKLKQDRFLRMLNYPK